MVQRNSTSGDPLERVKRRAYLSACLLGIPIDAAGYVIATDRAISTAYLVTALSLIVVAALTVSPIALHRAELIGFVLITTTFLWRAGVVVFSTASLGIEFAELITTVVMLCVVYLLAFLFYPRRLALGLSIGVLSLTAVIISAGLAATAISELPHRGMPLYKAFTMQAVFVALLYILAVTKEQMSASQARAQALAEIATTDALTGAHNRRHLTAVLEQHVADAQRTQRAVSVLLFDLDRFKRINDTYGHDAGDEVLRGFVSRISGVLRDADTFGRWGGEEFLVVAPGADAAAAATLAERCRVALRTLLLPSGDAVTVSVGVATRGADDRWDALVRAADHALYEAKERGRDRVVTAGT